MKAPQRAAVEKLLLEHGWVKGVTWYHPRCRGAGRNAPPRAWTFEEAMAIDRYGCYCTDEGERYIIAKVEEREAEEAAKPKLHLPEKPTGIIIP